MFRLRSAFGAGSFLLLGLAHGITVFPLLAAGSTFVAFVANVEVSKLFERTRDRTFWLAVLIVVYLCFNEVLHGNPDHLVDIRFYRSQGKPLYMLFLFIALFLLPTSALKRGVVWACLGFSLGAMAVQIFTYVIGFQSPLLGALAIDRIGGHNVVGSLVAQVTVLTFVLFRVVPRWRWKLVFGTVTIISFIFFVFGFSRGHSLGLIAALSVTHFLTIGRYRNVDSYFFGVIAPYLLIAAIGTAAILSYKTERWVNISGHKNFIFRLVYWKRAVDLAKSGVLFGTGLGGFAWKGGVMGSAGVPGLINATNSGEGPWEKSSELSTVGVEHTHNVYLQVLTESGLIGLVLWIVFFGFLAARAARLWGHGHSPPHIDDYGKLFGVTLIALIANAAFAGVTNGFTFLAPSDATLLYVIGPWVARMGVPRLSPRSRAAYSSAT